MNKREVNFFNKGYMCAIAIMLQQHDEPTMAEDALRENFMSIEQMKAAGIDSNDIKVLRPIVKEIERKKNLPTNR